MKKIALAGTSVGLALVMVAGGLVAPAYAVTYTVPGRSCNSGYEAQTVAYHRNTVQDGQYNGTSWSYTNRNNGASWGYSYDGYPSQSFTVGSIYGTNGGDVSSVVSSRCA